MKYCKQFVLITLIALYFSNTMAQGLTPTQIDDLNNMKKYWFYHYRLVNDFMTKGEAQGQCCIMGERSHGSLGTSTEAKWGDQTVILGQYISVLATEYRLLRSANQPTDTTLQELYYALKTFNRLDYEAETATNDDPSPNVFNSVNGYFMRDDVPKDFLDTIGYHPENNKLSRGVTSIYPVDIVSSDYSVHQDDVTNTNNEMSHDQIWHLMMGFALVRKCLDYNGEVITYHNKSLTNMDPSIPSNANLRDEALNITNRIMDRLRIHDWKVTLPCCPNSHVARGSDAVYLSYGAAEAACYIKYGNQSPDYYPFVHYCTSAHHGVSLWLAPAWMTIGQSAVAVGEEYKFESLAAIGNSWWNHAARFSIVTPEQIANIMWADRWHPRHIPGDIADLIANSFRSPSNVTMDNLTYKTQNYSPYNYYHFQLLNWVLHEDAPISIPAQTYINLLHDAPICGPYYFTPSNRSSSPEWTADSRVYDAENRGTTNNSSGQRGEFNGLDYMLYYNLYHLSMAAVTVPTVNYMDRIFTTVNYPVGNAGSFGSTTSRANLIGFNTITASNIVGAVTNPADVTYHAGNEIALLNGFSVSTGSEFHAYISPISCGEYESPTYRSMITSNDTSNQSPTNNLLASAAQTTYVNYPTYSENHYYTVRDNGSTNFAQNTYSKSETTSPIVAVKSKAVSGVNVIPNPSNGTFQIVVTHNDKFIGIKEMKVFDMMGNIIWSTGASGNTLYNVDISAYPQGVYYVRSVNELGETETKKIVKQ
jgi:hypothetical protein